MKLQFSRKIWCVIVWGTLCILTMPQVCGKSTSITVIVDGSAIHGADNTIQIASSAKDILFQVGDPPEIAGQKPERIRYKLEGVDPDWKQSNATMSMFVYFYDSNGDQSSRRLFEVRGESPGWNESVEKSTFTHRRETVTVPPGASSVGVAFSSAGSPACVGIYVIEDVLVTRASHEGRLPDKDGMSAVILDSTDFLRSERGATSANEWKADGIRPSMAKIINPYGPESSARAFCIIDDDTMVHAEWHSSQEEAPKVTPGEVLTITWNEIYNAAYGNMSHIRYDPLKPGSYCFKAQAVDVLGHLLPEESSINIVVPLPYWENPWFWITGSAILCVLLAMGSRYLTRAHFRRQLQRARLLEQERLRIARDLHDDLGARLAHLSLASANAESEDSIHAAQVHFQKISKMARELAAALSEVVWMVNPENDNLESLVAFLCRLIQGLCEPARIRCRIDAPSLVNEHNVPSMVRHHVSLAIKEAVNNVLKHSNATELQASIRVEASRLKISISDNGKGFDLDRVKRGNGLANMKHRMETLKGSVIVKRLEGGGTAIYFEVPIS